MYIHISNSETGNNKGSCGKLVFYLEKENKELLERHPTAQPELWFNHEDHAILPYQVKYDIDHNVAKLSKDEAKFFLVNISPSADELRFLKEKYGAAGAKEQLKHYANAVMDAYAKNFKKEYVKGNNDLLYFGKVEQNRYYTHKDEEVKQGLVKRGDKKPGEQMHVQVIVSRKDITDRIRLSPLNHSRGKNAEHSKKVGQFDRSAFKEIAEQLFDQAFSYDRELWETFRYANILKNGTTEQKLELREEERQIEQEYQQQLAYERRMAEQERQRELEQQRLREQRRDRSQGLSL